MGGRSLEGEEGGREGREVRALLGSAAAVDVVVLVEVVVLVLVQGQGARCLLFRWSAGRQTGRSGLLEGGCRDVVLECRMAGEAVGGDVEEGLVGDGQVGGDGLGVVAGGGEEMELDDGQEHDHWLGEDGVGGGV